MTDSRHAGYIGRRQYRRGRRIDTWRLALARHRRTGEWIGKGGCVEAWHRRRAGTGAPARLRSAPMRWRGIEP